MKMKIRFIYTRWEKRETRPHVFFYDIAEQKEFFNYEEIRKHRNFLLSKQMYSYLRALERNSTFLEKIEKLREKYQLPKNGIEEFSKSFYRLLTDDLGMESSDASRLNFKAKRECEEIVTELGLHPMLVSQIFPILVHNLVYLPVNTIVVIDPTESDYDIGERVGILIQSKITKHALLSFVDDNWNDIEAKLNLLPDKPKQSLTDRDERILTLRENEGKKFREIAEILAKEDNDFSINEDQIKNAYHRARKKISQM